jgi:signal peptide peptidase SppA
MWAIEASAIRQLTAGAGWGSGRPYAMTGRPDLAEVDLDDPGPTFQPIRAWKAGSVAILGLYGVIVPRDTLLNRMETVFYGATILERWTAALGRLAADPSVSAILLDVDSPGGQSDGVAEAADLVRRADRKKPVWAHTSGMMASAAYWIGSAARQVTAHAGAELGSIGAISIVADQDPEWLREHLGIRLNTFIASQGPNKDPDPETAEGAEFWQSRIDELGARFVAAVASHRKVSEAKVRRNFGGGWVMPGDKAVEVGMADRLGTLDEAIDALAADPGRRGRARPPASLPSGEAGEAVRGRARPAMAIIGRARPA